MRINEELYRLDLPPPQKDIICTSNELTRTSPSPEIGPRNKSFGPLPIRAMLLSTGAFLTVPTRKEVQEAGRPEVWSEIAEEVLAMCYLNIGSWTLHVPRGLYKFLPDLFVSLRAKVTSLTHVLPLPHRRNSALLA